VQPVSLDEFKARNLDFLAIGRFDTPKVTGFSGITNMKISLDLDRLAQGYTKSSPDVFNASWSSTFQKRRSRDECKSEPDRH
jgi:hypothetical protein